MSEKGFVIPGQKLGVIEEFVPGKNVYEGKDGVLRSEKAGLVQVKGDEVEISPTSDVEFPPREGEVVLGEVLRSEISKFHVKIVAIWEPRRSLSSSFMGWITKDEPENMLMRVGDVILARIEDVRFNEISLSLTGNHKLGVIFSRCPNCAAPLRKLGNTLVCPSCEAVYLDRTMSTLYGTNPYVEQ